MSIPRSSKGSRAIDQLRSSSEPTRPITKTQHLILYLFAFFHFRCCSSISGLSFAAYTSYPAGERCMLSDVNNSCFNVPSGLTKSPHSFKTPAFGVLPRLSVSSAACVFLMSS